MQAFYKGNKIIVASKGNEYPFTLAVEVTKSKAIQLMTKMIANGIDLYMSENGTVDYSQWESVTLK